jgi:hypothetical protein
MLLIFSSSLFGIPSFVRALVISNGSFKQVPDSEVGIHNPLILNSGVIMEQMPLIGNALIYDQEIGIREILPTETLII